MADQNASADKKTTIIFLTYPQESSQFWQERITAFEELDPFIHVEALYDQVTPDWPSQADVVLGFWPDRWPALVSPGKALDLTPLIESDSSFDASDFYPGALDLYRQDGHTWALPIGWSFKVIAYQPKLFQEANVPLPMSSWKWVDVVDAAQHLGHAPSGRPRGFANSTDLIIAAPNWLAERAGSPYLQQGAQIIPTLDAPRMQQAMEDYIAVAQHLTVLFDDAKVRTTAETLNAIAQGEAGLSIVDLTRAIDVSKQFPEVALFPLPPGEVAAQEAERAQSALFISAGSAHPRESWRWLRFLSQQDLGAYRWGDLPTRQSIAEASGVWATMSPVKGAIIRTTIANQAAVSYPTEHTGALIAYNALWKALGEAQYAHEDVRTALNHAQSVAIQAVQTATQGDAEPPSVPGVWISPPSSEQVIEFQVTSDPEIYRQAAAHFAAENPDLPVQISAFGASPPRECLEFTTLGSALEAAQLAEALETLNPLLEATRDLAPTAFFPDTLAAVSWQDELYGIPVAIKPPVLRFRPALFRALDLETPSASWTMEEVIQAAQKITDGGGGYFGLLPQPEEMDFVLNQLGISLFTAGTPPRPRFATPEVQTTLERLMRLGDKTTTVPVAFEDAVAFVSGGRVAMWFEGTTYFQINDGETAITPIRLRADVRFPLQTAALGIAKNAEHVQGCWAWITYLVRQGIHPPDGLSALRQPAASEAVRPGPQQAFYAAALETLQQARSTQTPPSPATKWAAWWLTQAMRETARGADLASALQTAQDKAEAFLACLGPAEADDLDRAAQCARQVDPAHPLAQMQR
jgi:multiple sugar transport system substrate-binding protein